jgi:hypothetical protein
VRPKFGLHSTIAGFAENLEIPVSSVTGSLENWRRELANDFDSDFILDGVEFGFKLIDEDSMPDSYDCDNYNSTVRENRVLVEKQIREEVEKGRYIISDIPPPVVSALGAIPKSDSKIRLIHDLSRPEGGLNQHCSDKSVKFPTIDDALKFVTPSSYLAKLDLKEAYRSIPLHPSCFGQTGLKWQFDGDSEATYLFDARLPFGASRSCRVFQSLTNAIVRMLKKLNIQSIGYIDDFLLVCDNELECADAMKVAVELIESLGLIVNWQKVKGPLRVIVFLGVEINCDSRTLALPAEKLLETKALINEWLLKKKATKRTIQRIVGKLNWCCRVIMGGRTFMRNIINLLVRAKMPHHYIRIGVAAHEDLKWWSKGLEIFNGSTPFVVDVPLPSSVFSTDACLQGGGGFSWGIGSSQIGFKILYRLLIVI